MAPGVSWSPAGSREANELTEIKGLIISALYFKDPDISTVAGAFAEILGKMLAAGFTTHEAMEEDVLLIADGIRAVVAREQAETAVKS